MTLQPSLSSDVELPLPFPHPFHGVIVHAIAGRLRIRFPHLSSDTALITHLDQKLQALSIIRSFTLNPTAASLIIFYDPDQWTSPAIPPIELLTVLESTCALSLKLPIRSAIRSSKKSTAEVSSDSTPVPISEPSDLTLFDPAFAQAQLRRVGGALIGGAAGDAVGGMVGATAGAIVLGPAGAILGSQIGVFVGGVIGAQVGAETLQHLDQIIPPTPSTKSPLTSEKMAASIQLRAGERIGETTGQVAGGLIGRAVFGRWGDRRRRHWQSTGRRCC
ncbi:MAG: hypothetical protein MUF49_29115 [Oculatellaceae cyanobacterium Prado106]|nr:hypothetical protein [Oculatellaceae cyanobacterium Prado106]